MTEAPSPLDDARIARHAWRRYWRLVRLMALAAFVCTAGALWWLYQQFGMVSIHLYIATAGGIFLMVMLGAALMGLVFLSSGSGHDESISDHLEEERNRP